jgi:AcrR family transcriptional regulator
VRQRRPQPRSRAKRQKILEAATQHFAEHGYQPTRVEDIAQKLGIAKGSIFQHFGSKEGLFLECYKKAVGEQPKYVDAPAEVIEQGFFSTLRYWLETAENRIRNNWTAFRISVIGDYGTSLTLKREINRFLDAKDPYGVSSFVRMGIERGELREDIDPAILGTTLHWMVERFEDACAAEELDPGIIRRGDRDNSSHQTATSQYLELIRGALARR